MPVLPADGRDGLQHGRIPSMPHENLQASPANLGIVILCQDVEHGLLDLLGSFPAQTLHRFLTKLRAKRSVLGEVDNGLESFRRTALPFLSTAFTEALPRPQSFPGGPAGVEDQAESILCLFFPGPGEPGTRQLSEVLITLETFEPFGESLDISGKTRRTVSSAGFTFFSGL